MLQHLWTGPISNAPVDVIQGAKSVEARAGPADHVLNNTKSTWATHPRVDGTRGRRPSASTSQTTHACFHFASAQAMTRLLKEADGHLVPRVTGCGSGALCCQVRPTGISKGVAVERIVKDLTERRFGPVEACVFHFPHPPRPCHSACSRPVRPAPSRSCERRILAASWRTDRRPRSLPCIPENAALFPPRRVAAPLRRSSTCDRWGVSAGAASSECAGAAVAQVDFALCIGHFLGRDEDIFTYLQQYMSALALQRRARPVRSPMR